MNSTQRSESCSSGLGREKANDVGKKTKRHLSEKEQEVLLASMKKLIADGWKSDNGFRGGYLNKLEQAMKNKFPGTDLKGIPHLNSKLQAWKRNYNSLTTMLSRSGIGFEDHMIDCTAEQWEEIVKADPNAKGMRRRSWPMFDHWKEIFGKDRATGDHAEDILDAVNDLFTQDHQAQDETQTDYHVSLDGLEDTSAWDQSVCGSEDIVGKNSACGVETGEAVTKGKGKKRKHTDTTDRVVEVLLEINRNTDARLDHLASRIGYEYDLDEARKSGYALLKNMSDLSTDDRFYVAEIFAAKPDRLMVFKGLPDSDRPLYVQRLLKLKNND